MSARFDLLTELERQERYLRELPEGYDFPLFNGRQAVESQRKSGYKSTARAAREVIDNAIEAGARTVRIVLERVNEASRAKGVHRDTVTSIAFIDDGPGMIPQMARLALSWGGGTHSEDPRFIGKFGFGLPNSGINQCRRVEVYTRTSGEEPWQRAVLDINDVSRFGRVTVPAPEVAALPAFVREYAERRGAARGAGTVVVWVNPDRLTRSTARALKEHMRDDFAVVYRYLLSRTSIIIEDDALRPADPLFLTPASMLYLPPEAGGARCTFERRLYVKLWRDKGGALRMRGLECQEQVDAARADPEVIAVEPIEVRVSRFPVGFASGQGGKGTDAARRFRYRRHRRGVSFVRAGREIDTVARLPSGNDLGRWPKLQSYAYHWGVEVKFSPGLDDAFQVAHDKQCVDPIEDFWRTMAWLKVDKAAQLENDWQREQRARREEERKAAEASALFSGDEGVVTAALVAAAMTGDMMGEATPDERKRERREQLGAEVERRAAESGAASDVAEATIRAEAERLPYAMGLFSAEGGVFMRPSYGNSLQVIAEINTAHPFYKDFYVKLFTEGVPLRARRAVDLMLLALAKGELESEKHKRAFYEDERVYVWSRFLHNALRLLDRREGADEEVEE